jgi:hypothetical protein
LLLSCKCTPAITTQQEKGTEQNSAKISGKVSHQYKTKGCGTVILVEKDSLVLLPQALQPEFDQDGLVISFQYHPLRKRNPEGCDIGFPVELSDVARSEKKKQ